MTGTPETTVGWDLGWGCLQLGARREEQTERSLEKVRGEKRKQVQGGYSDNSWKESLERNREKREGRGETNYTPTPFDSYFPFQMGPALLRNQFKRY